MNTTHSEHQRAVWFSSCGGLTGLRVPRICSHNRHWAEPSTYWQTVRDFVDEAVFARDYNQELTFYDSVAPVYPPQPHTPPSAPHLTSESTLSLLKSVL